MGNTHGNSVFIEIKSPQQFYKGGDIISGVVHLNIVTPVNVSQVLLKVVGKEKCRWTEQRGAGRDRHTVTIFGKHHVFKQVMQMPIYATGGFIGQFSYPFNFMLPVECPESIWLKDGSYWGSNAMEASVIYKVKCKIVIAGLFNSNLKGEQIFPVRNPPPQNIGQVYSENTKAIRRCCCFGEGNLHIKLLLNQSAFHIGEAAVAIAYINNETDSNVDKVKFRLTRHIVLTARGGHCKRDRQIVSQTVFQGL
jgi:hypothetical protein